MTENEILEMFTNEVWHTIVNTPEFLFRDWGHPTALAQDNIIASVVTSDEEKLSDFKPWRMPELRSEIILPRKTGLPPDQNVTYVSAKYGLRNYFALHSVDVSVMYEMSPSLAASLKKNPTCLRYRFLHVFYKEK